MKLEQGQLWNKGDTYYRIVKWARLSIDYLKLDSIDAERGERVSTSKKEFCRLLKGATLVTPEMLEEELDGELDDLDAPLSPDAADETTSLD